MLSTFLRTVAVLGILALASVAAADDASTYYQVRIGDLKITEGTLPQALSTHDWRFWQRAWAMLPYVVLNGEGEVHSSTSATRRDSVPGQCRN